MKKGKSDTIRKEVFITNGIDKQFQINNKNRKSIDASDLHKDFNEEKSIEKFFGEYIEHFLQLSEYNSGYVGMGIKSILDPTISKKPGDIDVAFVNEEMNELHCFEAKWIKIGKKINKLTGLKTAKKQLEGFMKYGFSSISLIIIRAIKHPAKPSVESRWALDKALREFVGIDFLEENGIGLIYVDHVQNANQSINTMEEVTFIFDRLPRINKTDPRIIEFLMEDPLMRKVQIENDKIKKGKVR